jgi:hypothetical protein
VALFVRNSLKEENISEYKLQPSKIINALVDFAKEFTDEDDEPSVLVHIKNACDSTE